MAAYSGQNGKILVGLLGGTDSIAEITKWTFDGKTKLTRWSSTATPGYEKCVASMYSGNGTFDFKIDNETPQYNNYVYEGSLLNLNLYLDATRYIYVPCHIESLHWEVDINEGPAVSGSATFAATGIYVYPTT